MNTDSDRKIVIGFDEYVGAVKLNSEWRFFYDMLSMWILDYASYHPEYNPTPHGWRTGLLQVDQTNAQVFCNALADRQIPIEQIPHTVKGTSTRQEPLTFVVNFDEKIFVNGWQDNIAIHEYAPQRWTAFEDDPNQHIPPELKALWDK